MEGFTLQGTVEKVTDGDTVRVTVPDVGLLKVRILGLDTEESYAGGSKPITPWGKAASAYAAQILPVGSPVTVEFPGTEPAVGPGPEGSKIVVRYLDNHARPLGYLHLPAPVEGTTDFSEIMIRKGYSPYFVKYGRANFAGHDHRYAAAERAAQRADVGVWNQLAANGIPEGVPPPRNYAKLSVWWELRARLIDRYRAFREANPAAALYNTRIDYARLVELAETGEPVTVFMDLTAGRTVGGRHYAIRSGSNAQPFTLFLPNEDSDSTQTVLRLLRNRYVTDTEERPRRNYAYVTGPLKMFGGRPEMRVTSADQIADHPPGAADT